MENRQSEHIEMEAKKRAVRYHHLCIPTQQAMPGEQHVPHLGFSHVPGTTNAYGIEWVRFHEGADLPAMIRERAHLAFEVASLDTMLLGERLIKGPYEEQPGVKVAFIDVLDFPVKLMQIDRAVTGLEIKNPVEASGKKLKYHHTGIPGNATWEREIKVPHLKLAYLPGKYNAYGVEWLRFEEGNPNPDVIKYIPHVAFEVEDMDEATKGEKVIYGPNRETPGIAVSFIEVAGATVEFLELDRTIVGNQYDG
jgi:hypothetical protein